MKFSVAAGPRFWQRAPLGVQIANAIEQQRSLVQACEPTYRLPTAEHCRAAHDDLLELLWVQKWSQWI